MVYLTFKWIIFNTVFSFGLEFLFYTFVSKNAPTLKQTYIKTETCQLYSGLFRIFLPMPNVIKIDPYSLELYCFKVGAFFETQCCFYWVQLQSL